MDVKIYIYIDLGRVLEFQLKNLQRTLCQVQDSMRVMINLEIQHIV